MMSTKSAGQHQEQQLLAPQALRGKSLIDKDNLRDEDFDKLVIKISNLVSGQSYLQKGKHNSTIDSTGETTQAQEDDAISTKAQEAKFATSSNRNDSLEMEPYHRLSQPKRPMNAFMVWGRAIRREIHLRFSNIQNALLSKALGRVWRSLDSAAKEPYVRKANLIKANHRRDYPDYRYQPRRVQERDGNRDKIYKATTKAPTTTITAGTNYITTSQQSSSNNKTTAYQQPSVSAFSSSYPSFDVEHSHTSSRNRLDLSGGNRRFCVEQDVHNTMPTPKDCYIPNFLYPDNNYMDSGLRNGIYCTGCVASGDMQHPKVQYYDEYQSSQQWRC